MITQKENLDWNDESWVFACPFHGLENNMFCFRSHDPELVENWHKFKVSWREISITSAEKIKHQKEWDEQYS